MDSQARSGKRNGGIKGRLTYFYINDELHKKIHINRGTDLLTAWNYPAHKRVGYSYADVRRRAERAYTTTETGKLLNRTRLTLENAILNGDIEAPQMTYGIQPGQQGKPYKYMWNEDHIFAMHDFLITQHRGRPRNDGMITPYNLPSRRELRARLDQEVVLYVKNDAGDFIPTWEANHF